MLKLTAVLAFTIVDTGMAVYNKHMYADNNTVGYTAHIAGAVAGLVVGFFALENRSATQFIGQPTYLIRFNEHTQSLLHTTIAVFMNCFQWLLPTMNGLWLAIANNGGWQQDLKSG